MKYIVFRRIMSCSLFLSLAGLHAAPLSLNDAIEVLKTQNLEIKASSLDTQNAHHDLKIAQGYSYGSLDFTQTASRSNDAGNVFGFKLSSREASFGDFGFSQFSSTNPNILTLQPKDLNYPNYQNFHQSKLTYSLPLYTGGKLSGYEKIASEMEKIKQLDTASVTAEKIYQTRKSYYDMALIEDSMRQMNVILDNITVLEKTVTAMIGEGYAKKVDLLEVQAKKANTIRMIQELKNNQKLTYHFLSFLLNQNVTEITTPNLQSLQSNISEADVLASNLDLQKASSGLEIRTQMIEVANAAYLPQVGVFGEASSADDTFLGDFSDHKAYTIGARLSWNLFNGGIDAHTIEKARIEHIKSKTQAQLAQKGVSLQYDQIRTEIENDDFQIQSLSKELELTETIYRNYEGRYREHLVSMNDVLIKQSQQIEKILALQNIKNQRNERIFALEKLTAGVQQ
ncbi:MAG TPA: TolC family protein [Sulfuricurvum sp.]|nr:MAG: transporter [Campylobacterales bacterium 16-40-21]OZA04150.1 MAG: transporter [Sulfuricurvum sp. 17-40-25]HQS66158.1 TolC family protein [Sulfuricurvum sp.]